MPVPKQAPSYARLIMLLKRSNRMTKYEAAEWVHVHQRTAQRRLQQIYDEGLIYIAEWKRPIESPNQWIPRYAWGNKEDAVKPDPIPHNEVQRKSRTNPENRDRMLAKRRVIRVIKKADKVADNQIFNLIVRRAA